MMKSDNLINQYNMLPPGSRVLCALSGGADSVVLTHFLATNAESFNIEVAAAHFSHGIRKDAANDEKNLCARLCESLNIEFFCDEGDSITFAKEHKIGLEEAARKLRYGFLEQTALQWNADKIATAHHRGDNVETLIMNACRGAGVKGLSGIPPTRGKLVRPLLDVSRAEIEQYAKDNELKYATDLTNFQPCCRRNEIRLLLIPQMKKNYPRCESLLCRFLSLARQTDGEIEKKAKVVTEKCSFSSGEASCEVSDVKACEKAVGARVFESLHKKAGGSFMLSSRHIEKLFDLCESDNPSAEISLPGVKAFRRYDRLVFKKPVLSEALSDKIIGMNESIGFGDWQLEVKDGVHPMSLILDASHVTLPLTVRARREGDSICLGGYRKTLKKLMIEKKIPKELRNSLPVLESQGKVVAAALLGADKSFKTNNAENAFSVIIRRIEK